MTQLRSLVDDLLGHNEGKVKWIAGMIGSMETYLQEGTLTKAEYDGMMEDIERYRKIIELSNDIQLNTKINQALCLLMEAAKYAKF